MKINKLLKSIIVYAKSKISHHNIVTLGKKMDFTF